MQSGTFQDFIDIMYDIKKPCTIEKKPKEAAKPKQKKPKAKKDSTEQLSVKNSELSLKPNNGVKKSVRKDTFEDLHGEGHSHDEGSIAKDSLDEGSTMTSLSPLHSLETLSSGTPATENKSTKKNKSKSKSNKKKKKAGRHDFRLKFKTEICKYWVDYGTCQYGDQCAFAHGTDEIRAKNHLAPNYKTKKCSKFHEEGHCPYGARCQFVHCLPKEHQLDEEDLIESYEDEVENAEIWFTEDPDCLCMRRNLRYRLPCFLKNVEA